MPVVSLWEATAIIQIIQAWDSPVVPFYGGEADDLLRQAIWTNCVEDSSSYQPDIQAAYRIIDSSKLPYVEVLASTTERPIDARDIESPKFVGTPTLGGGIVLCPFPPKKELDLPVTAWRALVRILRTYNIPVSLLGARTQWMDKVAFTESEILSEAPVIYKLACLASADLVIGVPNEWMWAAAGYGKSSIVLYPMDVPARRWYHYQNDKFGRIVYAPQALDIPRILASLAKLLPIVA